MRLSSCNSCGARIIWATSSTTGKRIPMDAEPVEAKPEARGLFALVKGLGDTPVAIAANAAWYGVALYVSHFATCPNADTHRRAT